MVNLAKWFARSYVQGHVYMLRFCNVIPRATCAGIAQVQNMQAGAIADSMQLLVAGSVQANHVIKDRLA
jgi:hypothetical protein